MELMKIERNILLNPGPATTTDTVKLAQVVPDICPREGEFTDMMGQVRSDLVRVVHGDPEEYTSVLFCGSGTICMDVCLNSLLPGEKKILVINNGSYSQRAVEICESYGLPHINLQFADSELPDMGRIESVLMENKDVALVYATHNETGTPEPEISFPQANCFERVINICELLNTQEMSREQVTEEYAFDIRQTNYYTDAARYLGLLEKHYEDGRKPIYSLSSLGKSIMNLKYKQRQLAFCEAILRHRVFKEVFNLSMEAGNIPDTSTIVGIMQKSNLYKVESMKTYIRRSSTISGWIHWILGLINE